MNRIRGEGWASILGRVLICERDSLTNRRVLDKVFSLVCERVPNRDLSTSDKTVTNGKSGCEGGREGWMTSDAGCSALALTHSDDDKGRGEEGGRGRNSSCSFLAPYTTICNLENRLKRSLSALGDANYASKNSLPKCSHIHVYVRIFRYLIFNVSQG